MKLLRLVYHSARAFLISALAMGAPSAQEFDFADQEEADWNRSLREGSADAFQRYLEAYPTGKHAEEAFGCLIGGALCEGSRVRDSAQEGILIDMY